MMIDEVTLRNWETHLRDAVEEQDLVYCEMIVNHLLSLKEQEYSNVEE